MKLLTIPKAAKESGVPYGELRRLINAGLVPVIMLPGGKRQYLYLEDLVAWLKAPKAAPIDPVAIAKMLEDAARSERCPSGFEKALNGGKYSWMERYT